MTKSTALKMAINQLSCLLPDDCPRPKCTNCEIKELLKELLNEELNKKEK